MGVKDWIVGGTLCALLAVSPTFLRAHESAVDIMTPQDKKMALFLEERCSDGNEHIALYSYYMDVLDDISFAVSSGSVAMRDGAIEDLLQTDNHIMVAHCHLLDRPIEIEGNITQLTNLQDTLGDAYKQFAARYYFQEVPSPMSGTENSNGEFKPSGDVFASVYNDTIAHYYHNEYGKIEHRIVLLEKDTPPRVIAFGIKEDYTCQLRERVNKFREARDLVQYLMDNCAPDSLITTAQEHVSKTERNLEYMRYFYIQNYNEEDMEYDGRHCGVGEVKNCDIPSFEGYVENINSDTIFYIKDLGYVE